MIASRCKNCQWWDDKHPSVATIPLELNKQRVGFCRKHKPGSVRIGIYSYGAQVVTDADEFCGEFREK